MKFDDFLASIDRTCPLSVAEQVATILATIPFDDAMRFNSARAAMPDDVSNAYGAFIRSQIKPAQDRAKAGRKASNEKRIHVTITLPESLVAQIPYPRSSFVERAILSLLSKEQ